MTIKITSRLGPKLQLTDYETVLIENSIEITEEYLTHPGTGDSPSSDIAELERCAKMLGYSIYRKDGSLSLIKAARALSKVTENETRQFIKAVKKLHDDGEFELR